LSAVRYCLLNVFAVTFSFIRIPRTHHAVVTRDPPNMAVCVRTILQYVSIQGLLFHLCPFYKASHSRHLSLENERVSLKIKIHCIRLEARSADLLGSASGSLFKILSFVASIIIPVCVPEDGPAVSKGSAYDHAFY